MDKKHDLTDEDVATDADLGLTELNTPLVLGSRSFFSIVKTVVSLAEELSS